jgi:Uncharacterized protein conserved in bacteria
VSEDRAATAFFGKTYDEAVDLLVEARDYFASQAPTDRANLDPIDELRASRECSRLTARLTHMIAWLLAQQAVLEGEIGRDEAAHVPWRLGGHAVCLGEPGVDTARLPPRLMRLLDKSRRLYVRVARLDELTARG